MACWGNKQNESGKYVVDKRKSNTKGNWVLVKKLRRQDDQIKAANEETRHYFTRKTIGLVMNLAVFFIKFMVQEDHGRRA